MRLGRCVLTRRRSEQIVLRRPTITRQQHRGSLGLPVAPIFAWGPCVS